MLLNITPEPSVNMVISSYDRCGSSVVLYVAMWVILQHITYDCGTPLNFPFTLYSATFLAFWGLSQVHGLIIITQWVQKTSRATCWLYLKRTIANLYKYNCNIVLLEVTWNLCEFPIHHENMPI